MKRILLLIILLITISSVMAVESGSNYIIKDINMCYGEYLVRVDSSVAEDDYIIPNCVKRDSNVWKCECNKNSETQVSIQTKADADNTYSFFIEYYIDEERIDENKRDTKVNRISFTPTEEYVPACENTTELDMISSFLLGLFVLVLIAILFMVVILFKEWKSFDNKLGEDSEKLKPKPKAKQLNSEDLDDMLEGL